MMSSLPWARAPTESEIKRAMRRAVATTLHWAANALARAAQQLSSAEVSEDWVSRTPVLEFHAEAGALEGALYVDGRLIGHLNGVTRL
jgi:hypothetical protein